MMSVLLHARGRVLRPGVLHRGVFHEGALHGGRRYFLCADVFANSILILVV